MDRQKFIDAHLTDYLKQFPDATDAELDDITSSSARTFDSQQKPQEYSAIPTMDTTKGFAENIAKDAPVLLGKVAEGGGDFAATAMQGTKKSVETLLSPFDTEAEAEAKRQATDVAYGSIKNALGEGVRNIQKYYQGEAPEFEPSAGVQAKSELYPTDYAERLAKAKEKQGQAKPEAPGMFEQIPGGREVRESIKAIPQFVGQSAADIGGLAGNLYEGDPETVQQFYEKPLTTAGMPALGVAIPLSIGYKKTIGKSTKAEVKPIELTPEEAQYKAKFDAELQKAQLENAVEAETPSITQPAPLSIRQEQPLNIPSEGMTIQSRRPALTIGEAERIGENLPKLKSSMTIESRRPIDELFTNIKPKEKIDAVAEISKLKPTTKTFEMNTNDISINPERFQYKTSTNAEGITDLYKNVEYDPKQAGSLTIWQDPSDGKYYVIDGHHRLEMAKRSNVPSVEVKLANDYGINTESEARLFGALKNIGDGRGTAFDAAKIFKELNIDKIGDIKSFKINPKTNVAKQGFALSKLSDLVWEGARNNIIPEEIAAQLGSELSETQQNSVYKQVLQYKNKYGDFPEKTKVNALIDSVKNLEGEAQIEMDMFGNVIETQPVWERASVVDYIQRELGQDKRAFKISTNKNIGERLHASETGTLNKEKGAQELQSTLTSIDVFNKMKDVKGEIASILNEAAQRIAKGENKTSVEKEALSNVKSKIATEYSKYYESGKSSIDGRKQTTDISEEIDLFSEPQKPVNKLFQKSKEFLGNEEGSISVGPIVDSLTSGYQTARQKLFEARKKMSELGNPIDNALTYFFEKYHPILKTLKGEEKTKGLETIDQKRNADNFIKQFLKDSGLAESVSKDLSGAGLNIDHLGAYAEARRTLYERDPRGIASRLDKQKAIDSLNEYNPKQQAALQKAFTDIQTEWQKTIIPNLIGSEVFDPKINNYISKNDNYSRNVVVEKALESVLQQGDAHSQKLMQHLSEFGSKKEILNPIEQMILYARTLNQFTSREVMKRNLVDMVAKNGEVSDVPKDRYAPVKYQHNGEWVEKYLPKDMAYALNEHPVEASTAGKFFDWLVFGNPVSKAMTRQIILNLAFIAGNSLMLDPITTWAQLPSWQSKLGYPLVHILTLAEKAGSTKAGQLAKYFGIDDLKATQEKMTKNKVYNIGSLYDRLMSGETQLEGIMEGIGLNQNVVEFFTGKKSKLAKATGAFENMASKIDNSSKESLYRYLNAFEGYRGQEKINQMTREMGTPATKRSGEGEALLRRGTMFGNAVLQAGRATAKNFADNPVQFAFSNIGVPTALAYGAYQWMKSDSDMKKRWDSLSEYQKKNFINIYTGEGKDGKPLFFSLPLPRMARIAYGVMIDLMENDKTFAEHAGNVVKGLAQGALSELPGALSQPLNLAGDVISYARGKAPYDYYRGQEVIPQKVMDADETLYKRIFGDKQMNNLATDKAFASYLLNTYATGGWFKLDSMKNVPEGFEWTKIAPMNRIFRMGGSGVASKLYKAKDEGKKLEARASLIIEDAVKKSVKEGKNIEITPELQEAIQFLPSALKNQMIKASIKNIKEETGDPNIDLITALQGATSMQKMLIIKKFQEMFPTEK